MRISEYPLTKRVSVNDLFLVETGSGTKIIISNDLAHSLYEMIDPEPTVVRPQTITDIGETDKIMIYKNGGYYGIRPSDKFYDKFNQLLIGRYNKRKVFRNKDFGHAITEAQAEAIRKGTFDDIFIGDYWSVDVGDKTHSVVIVDINYTKPSAFGTYITTSFMPNIVCMLTIYGTFNLHFSRPSSDSSVLSCLNFSFLDHSFLNDIETALETFFSPYTSTKYLFEKIQISGQPLDYSSTGVTSGRAYSRKIIIPSINMIDPEFNGMNLQSKIGDYNWFDTNKELTLSFFKYNGGSSVFWDNSDGRNQLLYSGVYMQKCVGILRYLGSTSGTRGVHVINTVKSGTMNGNYECNVNALKCRIPLIFMLQGITPVSSTYI